MKLGGQTLTLYKYMGVFTKYIKLYINANFFFQLEIIDKGLLNYLLFNPIYDGFKRGYLKTSVV